MTTGLVAIVMLLATPFLKLYHEHGFGSHVKRAKLSRLTGDAAWHLDRDAATLTLGGLDFPVQFLGTESFQSDTWLWADANGASELLPEALAACRDVRLSGRSLDPETFGRDRFTFVNRIGEPDASSLACVACGLAGGSAYYRSEHEAGAVYLLLNDPRIDAVPLDADLLCEAFAAFMWYPNDNRAAMERFVGSNELTVYESNDSDLSFELPNGELMTFRKKKVGDDSYQVSLNKL